MLEKEIEQYFCKAVKTRLSGWPLKMVCRIGLCFSRAERFILWSLKPPAKRHESCRSVCVRS